MEKGTTEQLPFERRMLVYADEDWVMLAGSAWEDQTGEVAAWVNATTGGVLAVSRSGGEWSAAGNVARALCGAVNALDRPVQGVLIPDRPPFDTPGLFRTLSPIGLPQSRRGHKASFAMPLGVRPGDLAAAGLTEPYVREAVEREAPAETGMVPDLGEEPDVRFMLPYSRALVVRKDYGDRWVQFRNCRYLAGPGHPRLGQKVVAFVPFKWAEPYFWRDSEQLPERLWLSAADGRFLCTCSAVSEGGETLRSRHVSPCAVLPFALPSWAPRFGLPGLDPCPRPA